MSSGKLLSFCLLALTAGSSCASVPGTPKGGLTVGGRKAALEVFQKSVDGTFFLTLKEVPGGRLKPPTTSYLTALSTDGRVTFERSFEHRFRVMMAVGFKPIGQGLYGYFLCYQQAVNCGDATYHFLDREFRDIFPYPVPNRDKELDSHEVLRAPNGNTFFMFLREDLRKASVSTEIQEWTPRGDVVFSWRVADHYAANDPNLLDPIHVNGMDLIDDGGLLLSLLIPSKIVKVAYPSGKVLWELSGRDWKFVNDPFNGFLHQHGARHLKNGNILVFDNGNVTRPSRAVEYKLDFALRQAELVWEYRYPGEEPHRLIGGSVQRLSNGNTLIGWGAPDFERARAHKPGDVSILFTEVDPDRRVVRELRSTGPQVSYQVWFEEGARR